MPEPSTTPADNPTTDDAAKADSTTVTDPNTGTDNQPAEADKGTSDNPDDASKSTDKSADGDKTPTDDKKGEAPASQFDDDLDTWIEGRKAPKPTTDDERQAYQDLRNEQREFTKSQQAKVAAKSAKELGDAVHDSKPDNSDDDEDDPLQKDVNSVKEQLNAERTTRLQSEFYSDNNVSDEEGKAILDIYKEKMSAAETPAAKQRAFDIWSTPDALPDLLDLARVRIAKGSDNSQQVADEAARKEREKIARESEANSPGRGASSHTSGDKTPDQERLERFDNWD